MRRQVFKWITLLGIFALSAGIGGTAQVLFTNVPVRVPVVFAWCIRGGLIVAVLGWYFGGFGKKK